MKRVSRTSIYVSIEGVYDFVNRLRQAGVVQAPAGSGKTTALMELARINRSGVYIRVAPSQGTLKAGISLITSALDIDVRSDSADCSRNASTLKCAAIVVMIRSHLRFMTTQLNRFARCRESKTRESITRKS